MVRFILQLIIVLFATLRCALAIEKQYVFQQITPENGLAYQVNSIVAGVKSGYAWMGTNSGIGRFNGYELKRYLTAKVYQLIEDNQSNIWAATAEGVFRYYAYEDVFLPVCDEQGAIVQAYSICRIPHGLLLGERGRIYQYDDATNQVKQLMTLPETCDYNITNLELWDSQTLILSNRWNQSYWVNISSGKIRELPFPCHRVAGLLKDSQGHFWISSYGEGVRCYSAEGKLLHHLHKGNSEVSCNVVLSLAEYDGKIWMGTDGDGIFTFQPDTHEVTHLKHTPGDSNSLPSNSILSLYADAENGIWAGSVRSGLFNIKEVGIRLYSDALPGTHYGLSLKTVLSLFQEEGEEDIWIGTDGGGLNRFVPRDQKFYHYPATWGDKVVSLAGTDRSHLLVSLFDKGLFLYDKQARSYKPLTIVNDSINAFICQQGKSVNLLRHAPDEVLLLSEHPYCYNWKKHTFKEITFDSGKFSLQGEMKTIAMQENTVYVHDISRIYSLDAEHHVLGSLLAFKNDTIIHAASMDEHGELWIGSNYGLYHLLPTTGECRFISTNLISNLTSVTCDLRGRVWIGSNDQLFAYLIEEDCLIPYDSPDGVMPNEYLAKPRLLTNQGDIYLGTVNGLLHISPELPKEKIRQPILELAKVEVGGKRMDYPKGKILKLKEQPIPVVLSVLARNKDIFRKPAYRYTIHRSGLEPVYSYLPTLTLNGLPAGTYCITVACSTRMGGWTEDYPILELIVLQPWYKSGWFILAVLFFLALVLVFISAWVFRRRENQLKWEMREREKQMYEEKVRFLININHELRTPLTLIHAPLKQLIERLSPEDEQYRLLQGIANQSNRMKKLLNMVLDVRKMEVKESVLHIEEVRLDEWLNQILEDFRPEAALKHLTLVSRYELEDYLFCCDKEKCTTVVTNLLVNAVKYSNEGGEILLVVKPVDDGKTLRLSISDQGVGLKNVDVKQLFTRFYQGNNSRPGTGIGLSYAKILVEQQGGKIGAYDHVGESGATFWVELPSGMKPAKQLLHPQPYLNELLVSVENVEHVPSEMPYQEETKSKRLLVVDDNQEMAAYLTSALAPYFQEVQTASNGVEALELCKQWLPDVVVSDIQMPEMNGYELCKRIKENLDISHIPVLLLTARTDEESKIFGYKNGADNYLTKPFEISTLYTAVLSLLQNRERTRKEYTEVGNTSLPTPEESTFSPVDEKFLNKLNEVIMNNLNNPELGVEFLCSEMYISRASLYNKLKALTGMGSNSYVAKIRIEQAVKLLTSTDMHINEISDAVGFSSSRYFNRVFKEMMGCSPSQYKNPRRYSGDSEPGPKGGSREQIDGGVE